MKFEINFICFLINLKYLFGMDDIDFGYDI